jgi:hypothetical protein
MIDREQEFVALFITFRNGSFLELRTFGEKKKLIVFDILIDLGHYF